MYYKVDIKVILRNEVKDTKGEVISKILKINNIEQNAQVRIGKFFSFNIHSDSYNNAIEKIKYISENILSNDVLEDYEIIGIKEL